MEADNHGIRIINRRETSDRIGPAENNLAVLEGYATGIGPPLKVWIPRVHTALHLLRLGEGGLGPKCRERFRSGGLMPIADSVESSKCDPGSSNGEEQCDDRNPY